MKRLLTFLLSHARPWIYKPQEKGTTFYGIQISLPWRDKKNRQVDTDQDGTSNHQQQKQNE